MIRTRKKRNKNLKQIKYVDSNGNPLGKNSEYVLMEDVLENIIEEGTFVTEDIINDVNFKSNKEIVFTNVDVLPNNEPGRSKIVGKDNDIYFITSNGMQYKMKNNVQSRVMDVDTKIFVGSNEFNNGLKLTGDKLGINYANYNDYGVVRIGQNSGLNIENGVLSIDESLKTDMSDKKIIYQNIKNKEQYTFNIPFVDWFDKGYNNIDIYTYYKVDAYDLDDDEPEYKYHSIPVVSLYVDNELFRGVYYHEFLNKSFKSNNEIVIISGALYKHLLVIKVDQADDSSDSELKLLVKVRK